MFEKFLKELSSELDKAGVSDKESIVDDYIKRYNDLLSQNLSPFEIIVLFGDPADIARRFISPDYNRSARQSLKNNSMLKKEVNKKTQSNLLDMTSLDLSDVEIDEHENLSEYRNEKEIVNKNIENYKAFIYQLENEIEEIEDKIKILLDEIARRKREKQAGISANENPITEKEINLAMELEKELQKKQEQLMDFYKSRKNVSTSSPTVKKAGLRNTDDFQKKAEANKKKILEQIPSEKVVKKEKADTKKISKTQGSTAFSDEKSNTVSKDINDGLVKSDSENSSVYNSDTKKTESSVSTGNVFSFEEADKDGSLKSSANKDSVTSQKTIDANTEEIKKQTVSQTEQSGADSVTDSDSISANDAKQNNVSDKNKDSVSGSSVNTEYGTDTDGDGTKTEQNKKYTTVEYYDSETGENISNFLNIQFYRDPNSGKTHITPEKGEAKQNVKRIKVVEEIETSGAHKSEDGTGDGIEKVAHDLTSNSKEKKESPSSENIEQGTDNDLKSDLDKLKTSDSIDTEDKNADKSNGETENKGIEKDSSENSDLNQVVIEERNEQELGFGKDIKSDFSENNEGTIVESVKNEQSKSEEVKNDQTVNEEGPKKESSLRKEENNIKNPFLEKDYTFVGGKKINIDFSEEKNAISENKENKTDENSEGLNQDLSALKNTAVNNEESKKNADGIGDKAIDSNEKAVTDSKDISNGNFVQPSVGTAAAENGDKIEEVSKENIIPPVSDKNEDIINGSSISSESIATEKSIENKETLVISEDGNTADKEIEQKKQDIIVKDESADKEEKQGELKSLSSEDKDKAQTDGSGESRIYKKGIDVIVKKADTKEDKSYIKDKARAIEKGILEEHIDDLVFADTKMRGWHSVKTKVKKPKVIRKSEILPDKINIDEINMDIVEAEDTVRIVQCGNPPVQKQATLQSPLMKTGTISNQIENKVQVSTETAVAEKTEVHEEPYAEHIPLSEVLYKRPEEGKILRRENLPFMITGIVFAVFMAALINLVTLFGGLFIIITSLNFLAGNFSNTVVIASQLNISIVLIFTGLLMIAGIGLCDVYVIKWIIESIRDCYEVVRLLNKNKEMQDEPLYEVVKIPTSTYEPRIFNVGNKKPIEVLKKPGGLSDDLIYNKEIKKNKSKSEHKTEIKKTESEQNSSVIEDKEKDKEITSAVNESSADAYANSSAVNENSTVDYTDSDNKTVNTNNLVVDDKKDSNVQNVKTEGVLSDKNNSYTVIRDGGGEKSSTESIFANEGKINRQSENNVGLQNTTENAAPVETSEKIEETIKVEQVVEKSVESAIPVKNSPKHKLEDYEFRRIMKERAEKVASLNIDHERGTSGDLADVYAGEKMLHSEAKERTDIIPSEEEKERIREELKNDFKQDALKKEIKSAKELRKAEKEEKKKAKLFKKMTEKASMPEKIQPKDKDGLKMEDTVIEGINVGANKNIGNNTVSQNNTEDADTVFEKHIEKINAVSEKKAEKDGEMKNQSDGKDNNVKQENSTLSEKSESRNIPIENTADKKEDNMKDLLFTDPDKKALSSDDMPKSGYKEVKDDPQNSRTQQLQKGESVPEVSLVTPEKSESQNPDNDKNKKDKDKNDKQGGGDVNINDWFF